MHLEKAMAPHSSTLAWKIPWMEEPGGLQSMGSLRVRHDWVTSLSLFTFMHWRRRWQPTPVLEKTLESPLDCKEIKPVNPKGNQSWTLIERTDAEAEAPILWPFDAKNWLIGKDPDAGKDWSLEEKGMAENEMVEWYHQINGHGLEQTLGDCEAQGSLACCCLWRSQRTGRDLAGQQ